MNFNITEMDGSQECLLEITNAVNIIPDDFQEISIGDDILSKVFKKHVVISGRAPVFIYMYVALRVFQADAVQISIKQVQEPVPFTVFPVGNGNINTHTSVPNIVRCGDLLVFEYHCSNAAPVEIKDLPALTEALPISSGKTKKIVIVGKMPTWLAAAFAISAKSKGWETIAYLMPRFDGAVVLFPHLKIEAPLPELQKRGAVIGVVGDPNSGKSVFAELLEQAGVSVGIDIWRYDCDYAAPTPNWYLYMMKNGRNEEGCEWRQLYKRKWVPGAEKELVSDLQNIRKYINVTIADLPGGRHEKNLAQRIPPGREILFHEVDLFIIVAKHQDGFDSGNAWRNELKRIGMESKILLTLYSEQPEQDISILEVNNQWHILGLDRTHEAAASVRNELWNLIQNSLNEYGCPLDIQSGTDI